MLHCFMVYLGSYFIVPVLWHVPGFAWCVLFLRDITFTFLKEQIIQELKKQDLPDQVSGTN